MSRIRTIKPEFPHSESIGKLSRDARLLFILLWTFVDDSGRCRAASRMLASLLYPYDNDANRSMDNWLGELELHGHLVMYDVDGSRYLEVCNWLKHQKIDHPSKSRLPAPSESLAKPREDSRSLAPDLGPSTLDLGPSTLDHINGVDGESWPKDFRERFWQAYPRKVAKRDGIAALEKARKRREVPFARLLGAIGGIDTSNPKFIPYPATWLNRGQYLDGPVATGPPIDDAEFERLKANYEAKLLAKAS